MIFIYLFRCNKFSGISRVDHCSVIYTVKSYKCTADFQPFNYTAHCHQKYNWFLIWKICITTPVFCLLLSFPISMQDPQRQDFVFLPSSAVILPAWTVHAQSRCLHESLSLLSEKWMSGWILCWQTVVIALSPVLVWIWKNHLNLLRKMSIFCHRHHW